MTDFSKIGETFGQCFTADFHGVGIMNFIVVMLSFLFVDMFDTIGTLIGVSDKAGMLDEDGKLPNVKQALMQMQLLLLQVRSLVRLQLQHS